jgi:LPS sulfotransferase NodH
MNTVILGTQRSGSTLLCAELTDIGGMGAPGEHFLGWLQQARPSARLLPPDILNALKLGRSKDGTIGLKLMTDYLPRLATAAAERATETTAEQHSAGFLRSLAELTGPTAYYRIVRRDVFDQALSRYMAFATGVYFLTEHGVLTGGDNAGAKRSPEAVLETFHPPTLHQYEIDIAEENAFLTRICDALDAPVLTVVYEELVDDRDPVLRACCAHAGVSPPPEWPRRWMKKVVDQQVREAFRRRSTQARACV